MQSFDAVCGGLSQTHTCSVWQVLRLGEKTPCSALATTGFKIAVELLLVSALSREICEDTLINRSTGVIASPCGFGFLCG